MSYDLKIKKEFARFEDQISNYRWYINQPKPKFVYNDMREGQALPVVEWLQADGDELEYIKKRFHNLPFAESICLWRGEMAQFILDNL